MVYLEASESEGPDKFYPLLKACVAGVGVLRFLPYHPGHGDAQLKSKVTFNTSCLLPSPRSPWSRGRKDSKNLLNKYIL